MASKDWDVVCGDGSKPVAGEQELPEELLPKEKDEVCVCADFHVCRHADD